MINDPLFEENVKLSFKKAKEHIKHLENKINSNNFSLEQIKKEISDFKDKISKILTSFEEIKQEKPSFDHQISIGNQGVLNKQTNKQTVKQTNKHIIIDQSGQISKFQVDIEEHFKTLTKQELLVFLTIYQLEEELNRKIKFLDISRRLSLSESCIRGYVKRLLEKGTPLSREKINNKIVLLSIYPQFKSLNLKNRLSDLYYEVDSGQTKLFDSY